jgi:hypothetical protein
VLEYFGIILPSAATDLSFPRQIIGVFRRGRSPNMKEDAYGKLVDALNKLPNGFPRTKSGVDIAILKMILAN